MRIVQACPYAWDAPGGVQVHVRQLAARLRARGHDVVVLAPGHPDAWEPGVRIVGRPVRIPYNAHTTRYPERTQAETSQYGGGRTDTWRPHPLG